ncbi:hypothetical protein FJZ19_00255 [Candidatus Pacearchaeota archaeon]|nr:hypothetical protein [Candidatus Pacearchaeota archaeon]
MARKIQKIILQNKRGFEFSFTWLFAILVGACVLFLAIYGATQLINQGEYKSNTQIAKQLTILFNPLETGLASGKSTHVDLNTETRIYNKCSSSGAFGSQDFSISQKSGFMKEWPKPGFDITLSNKYVFSGEIEQGKRISFFSKPFEMPFKVSEIIFLTTKKYCFVNSPDFIKEEIRALNLDIKLENCSTPDTKVCFNSGNCEINVHPSCTGFGCGNEYETGYVTKNSKTLKFTGSLIYGAIFSDAEIYECNLKRLMLRIQQICYVYSDELRFMSTRGCGNVMSTSLINLANAAGSTTNSVGFENLRQAAKTVKQANDAAKEGCKIW